MPQEDHIYRVIELAGTSNKSFEDAVATAIGRAHPYAEWLADVRSVPLQHH